MTTYYYKDIPDYFFNKFRAVRSCLDNFHNVMQIAEIVNNCHDCLVENFDDGFDIAIFTQEARRFLVRTTDGYMSMSFPFQIVVNEGHIISFNCDMVNEPVNGLFISAMKNAVNTVEQYGFPYEEVIVSLADNFDFTIDKATLYYDTFITLIAEDHGYLRFDDDVKRENGDIHPRYHFDLFFKNSSGIKLGYHKRAEFNCFLPLFNKEIPKFYLTSN